MHPHALQKIHENEEVRTALRLLELGIDELKKISGGNDFYHLPLLLLSNGLERLLKVMLCIDFYQDHGIYPDVKYLKGKKNKLGHNLTYLLSRIQSFFEKQDYLQIPVAQEDMSFLKNDETLILILETLENYASGGRYYDLDAMLIEKETEKDPKRQWENIETKILQSFPNWKDYVNNPNLMAEMWIKINRLLTEKICRLVRALCRMLTIGPLAKEGKIHCSQISSFLHLNDEELPTGHRKSP